MITSLNCMNGCILSFLRPLPLALILPQELENDLLHLRRGVVLGKEFPHLIGAEADLFALVGFGLGHDGENAVHGQIATLAALLQGNGLG